MKKLLLILALFIVWNTSAAEFTKEEPSLVNSIMNYCSKLFNSLPLGKGSSRAQVVPPEQNIVGYVQESFSHYNRTNNNLLLNSSDISATYKALHLVDGGVRVVCQLHKKSTSREIAYILYEYQSRNGVVDKTAEIDYLTVDKNYARHKLGTILVTYAQNHLKQVGCQEIKVCAMPMGTDVCSERVKQLPSLIDFYECLGFEIDGEDNKGRLPLQDMIYKIPHK